MKVNIKREALLKVLNLIIGAVEKKNTLPILSNVLINAKPEFLKITATDLEIELVGVIRDFCLIEEGEITVSGRKLIDICKAIPPECDIFLNTDKNNLLINFGTSSFKLLTLPAVDFPISEKISSSFSMTLSAELIKQLIDKTAFSMAQQDVRSFLNGLLFEFTPNQINVVAADGHRLALASIREKFISDNSFKIVLPRKGALELAHLLNNNDKNVNFIISDSYLRIEDNDFIFTSKLIETKFPNYNESLKRCFNHFFIISRDSLKESLARISLLSSDTCRGIRLLLSNNNLKIFANNPEQEEAREHIDIFYQGPDIEVGVNANYLIDVCNNISDNDIKLMFANNISAINIVGIKNNQENEHSHYIIMPIKL